MARLLFPNEVWDELQKRAKTSRSLTAVVGYIGHKPTPLISWPKNSRVIADLSVQTVKQGSSSARGAYQLFRHGVQVYQRQALHAKVYLFDKAAIVGSANLSERSHDTLEEVAVLLTAKNELISIRKFANTVLRDPATIQLDANILKQRIKIEPRSVPTKFPTKRKGSRTLGQRIWLIPCHPDEGETRLEKAAKRQVAKTFMSEERISSTRQIEWFNEIGKGLSIRIMDGDYVFFIWEKTVRSPYGRMEGAYLALGGADLGRRLGSRRYCLPMVPFRNRTRALQINSFKTILSLLGDKRTLNKACEKMTSKTKLLDKGARKHFLSLAKGLGWNVT